MKKIFIIHGWTYTTDAWNACIDVLRTRDLEPVMLSVPGLMSASEDVWTLEKYVEWLRREIKDDFPVILIGHSNGGRIAIACAARYPEYVKHLVLIDAAGIVHHEFLLEAKRTMGKILAKIGRRMTTSRFVRKVFYRLIDARDYERATPAMRETMKNLIEYDATPELQKIVAPTLIIWGKHDDATPVSDAYTLHAGIRQSGVNVIPDAAHSPHATHPDTVGALIADWIVR